MSGGTPIQLSYLICATPRSGSNFLCDVLRSTGVAGRPDDYFWNRPFWLSCWGVSDTTSFVRRLVQEGTTANGVFGSKLMWDQTENVVSELAAILGRSEAHSPVVLEDVFPNLHHVWLTRRDKLRQGISYYRALETKRWRSTDDPRGPAVEPPFNFEAIQSLVQLSVWEDQAWDDYFRQCGISPLVVVYEELAQAPQAEAQRILTYLGVPAPAPEACGAWRHQRQADALTDEWVERFTRQLRAFRTPP